MVVEVLAYTVKVLMELVALQISAPVKEAMEAPEVKMEEMGHITPMLPATVVNMVGDQVLTAVVVPHMMEEAEQLELFGPELLDNFLQLILQI